MINWLELDLILEPVCKTEFGELSLPCPPSYLFLGLGPDDPRDFLLIGDRGNPRPPNNAILHRIWPQRIKFFQSASGRNLKALIETKSCIYNGFPSESWAVRISEALMSSKPESLYALKHDLNHICFNELYFTHEVFFPDI